MTAGVDQMGLTFDFVERAGEKDVERFVVSLVRLAAGARLKDLHVDAAMDDDYFVGELLAAFPQDKVAVVLRNGDDEVRRGDFFPQHVPVAVKVAAVRGKAEGNAGQTMDDKRRGRGMAAKISVKVGDPLLRHATGEVHGCR